VGLLEPKPQKRQREPDAVRSGGELLGEEDQPDRPEEIQRPGDRTGDEDYCEKALRGTRAFPYPFQILTSLKYLMAPG
jgi:hypothetical protein